MLQNLHCWFFCVPDGSAAKLSCPELTTHDVFPWQAQLLSLYDPAGRPDVGDLGPLVIAAWGRTWTAHRFHIPAIKWLTSVSGIG